MDPLDLARYRRCVVLTGAGISAGAGLPTYRGAGGLWNDAEVRARSHRDALKDLDGLWAFFGPLRASVLAVAPTIAHGALVTMKERFPALAVTILTQNVDGLHQRAVRSVDIDVVELHGSLLRSRCTGCDRPPYADTVGHVAAPRCDRCGGGIRPDVVLFEEALGVDEERKAKRALADCDLFLAIGTSGCVWPASSFVRSAHYAGARTCFVNLEPMAVSNPYFGASYLGPADDVVPALLGVTPT
jgi:NAD-dependent deacetylase